MSHAPHDHHPEDNSVNVKIAVFFVVVLAAITFIGLMSLSALSITTWGLKL